MTVPRRQALILGGGVFAALASPRGLLAAEEEVIEMRGTARGERVWFDPRGLAALPGAIIRFVNRDPGNSHTATAYHPAILDRVRRIPKAAEPWDSGSLLPGESFAVTLTAPGVYDFYCQPHEAMGMAGRIVIGTPETPGWEGPGADTADTDAELRKALPPVGDILAQKRIGAPE